MRIPLLGGAYTAASVIASAQRSVNLYSEPVPEAQGEPSRAANLPTPGTRLLGTIGAGPIRGIRQCTTGGVYVVSGDTLYSVDVSNWTGTALGTLTPGLKTPVSMQDNGLDMVVVDGMIAGWDVTLASNAFAPIPTADGIFPGADRVDYLDTFFILNKPATPQFYISGSLAVTFDSLDFANKEAYSDLLVTVVVAKRLVYLFGERTTEIWYDAGATDIGAGSFPFAAMQSEVFIDHGCVAKYSPAVYDNSVFWLTRDRQGQGIVMMVSGYQTKRISTYAIEAEIAGYERISDAIGFTYQLAGHTFYVLTFPHADKTWSYDIATGLWHQWAWIDTNGDEHRHRANCFWRVNDTLVVGDWQNGNLYALDNRVFTDNGQPIKRVRSFPHMLADGKRVFYRQFLADMETGNAPLIPIPTPPAVLSGFTALPLPAGGLNGAAYGISADGNTVVGFVNPTGGDADSSRRACYWISGVLTVFGPDQSAAICVSADGSVIVGSTFTPWRWTATGGFVAFGASGNDVSAASADAIRVVGDYLYASPRLQACYWDGPTRTDLGFLPGCDESNASAVSADGSVIVGTSYFRTSLSTTEKAWRWTSATGMVALPLPPGMATARGNGVSADGAVVVGAASPTGSGGDVAWKWTAATGSVLVPDMISATGISGDGNTIMGSCFSSVDGFTSSYLGYNTTAGTTVPTPVVLDPTDPAVAGIPGTYPDGVSADGKTFVGFSYGTNTKPWVYHIAAPVAVTATTSVNMISLSWSNDRGHSYGSPVAQSIGEAGEYRTSLQWQRLEYSRDRVFRLEWSVPMRTALLGCYVDVTPASS